VLTEHSVEEAAAAAGLPPDSARFVESTGSTNADLMAAGNAGAPAWTVLVAGHQTSGRGRLGRSWEAPPGSSLLVSVLLRPSVAADAPLVSLAAALAMGEAIEGASNVQVRSEWPNDLMTASGRKLAGVLAESRIEDGRLAHMVVGVGVNLTQAPDDFPSDLRLPATSLAMEGASPPPEEVLGGFLRGLRGRYDPERPEFPRVVVEAYRERCATVGRRVRATTVGGAVVEGEAVDIGDAGELIVATADGEARVAFGELERLG
jgi:BirA family transcriptional regulator, biotin operon repressor / biotin---[acetyl-CoA-carboxylase] ligase